MIHSTSIETLSSGSIAHPSDPSYFKGIGYFCASLLAGITSIALLLIGISLILGAFAACGLHLYNVILKKLELIPVVLLLETPLCLAIFGSLGLGALSVGNKFISYAYIFGVRGKRHFEALASSP